MPAYQFVRVSGPSMVPTLHDGDLVLVRLGARIAAGDVVLARFRSLPDRYVLKRARDRQDGGWMLDSDNPFAAGDSRRHGVGDVLGRVLLRWPRTERGRRRLVPRPIRR